MSMSTCPPSIRIRTFMTSTTSIRMIPPIRRASRIRTHTGTPGYSTLILTRPICTTTIGIEAKTWSGLLMSAIGTWRTLQPGRRCPLSG